MPSTTLIGRARGVLLGQAIGDALGAPVEGLHPQQIRAYYGQIDGFVDGILAWKKKPHRWRLPGLYTDDTQQALAVADCLLGCGTIDEQVLAEIFLALATPRGSFLGAYRGAGRSFRLFLEALERGVPPAHTGQESAGIGAAVRIAPVALFAFERDLDLLSLVLGASLLTHRDIRSVAGAVAVASTLVRLLAREPREPSFLFLVAADVARAESEIALRHPQVASVQAHGRCMSTAIARVESLLDLPREQALGALVDEANRHGASPVCRKPTMGFSPACIPTCLYFLMTAERFEDALLEIVNLGGDADSAGAILGAFLGACFGEDAIPRKWLDELHNESGVALRAEALIRHSTNGLSIPDLVDTERELSVREAARRERYLSHRERPGDLGANRRI